MIFDLQEIDSDHVVAADVAIIGGGTAGLLMAHELARNGLAVCVLEAGPVQLAEASRDPSNEVELEGDLYRGATSGRFRCLGGTSTRWGGAMLPFSAYDFNGTIDGQTFRWPVGYDELVGSSGRLHELFGLCEGSFEDPSHLELGSSQDFLTRVAKWPPFKKRNVARLFSSSLKRSSVISVWVNAEVSSIELAHGATVETISARSANGRTLRLRSRQFIVAAGAIESTRLMLLLDARHDGRLFSEFDVIGRYFHDHLSARAAQICFRRPSYSNMLGGFSFDGRTMRSVRFEVAPAARLKYRLPGGFAQSIFESSSQGGFVGLRDAFRAIQRGKAPTWQHLRMIAADTPWLTVAIWNRFVLKRVIAPNDAKFWLNLAIEQAPHRENRISLSPAKTDSRGLPLAHIAWRVREVDFDNFERLFACFMDFYVRNGLEKIAVLQRRPEAAIVSDLREGGGIFHPGGTLRMGESPNKGVVDRDLRVYGIRNLRVVSTATFPTGGAANPTYTLLLFALRACAQISQELRAGV